MSTEVIIIMSPKITVDFKEDGNIKVNNSPDSKISLRGETIGKWHHSITTVTGPDGEVQAEIRIIDRDK